jgi:hypothetical protein
MLQQIQILDAAQINPKKWDNCLANSSNELIYAQYHYLSVLCDNWAGLIIGDYETIFPLPWRKKFGIKYFYAPPFIQQLGCFGNLSDLPSKSIWTAINNFAKYGDLFLNFANAFLLEGIEFTDKKNFVLNLNEVYPNIYKNYHSDLVKNLIKAKKHHLLYSNELSIESSIQIFKTNYEDRFPEFRNRDFDQFQKACIKLSTFDKCITRTILTENKKEILATAILLRTKKRIYLIMNATNPQGRLFAANHYLIDQIIQEYSEEEIEFDFEGSESKGIQTFYENFHPINQPYFHVRINRLPYLINLIREMTT